MYFSSVSHKVFSKVYTNFVETWPTPGYFKVWIFKNLIIGEKIRLVSTTISLLSDDKHASHRVGV